MKNFNCLTVEVLSAVELASVKGGYGIPSPVIIEEFSVGYGIPSPVIIEE